MEGEHKIDFSIRDEIKAHKEQTDKFQKIESSSGSFWAVYDSKLHDLDTLFEISGENQGLAEYLDREYQEKVGQLVGLELGGPGSNLFSDLNADKCRFLKSVGVVLVDKRMDHTKEKDRKNNHEVIEANAFSTNFDDKELPGFEKIRSWVKENGPVDFLVEAMHLPIYVFNESSAFFMNIVSRWYKLLSQNGVMLVQAPKFSPDFLQETKERLATLNVDLNFRFASDGLTYLIIKRLPNSPDQLT